MSTICYSCNGSRKTNNIEWEPCHYCKGTGCIQTGIAIGICGHCHGLGKVSKTRPIYCLTCNGRGIISY